ncbi:hypothetical protein BHE74_00043581 [Ensete ventricosum]|uniref:Peroxidase n=1 Tax=Ensete ventricosum TaxID=4639 RepID=A0A426Y6A9_ENSVE|nr:hypothetical protein B296_00047889 [Ensete ventricosum]RWV87646.1 hypothetical protein GW17_00050337 [Ensete ventricosum]RWW50189.1 hypothetical protein BHE74_00043581 [Ensete ventricosum]RZS26166.1 hypothetical protein BHM03_00059472 [Ensete ventricosum]
MVLAAVALSPLCFAFPYGGPFLYPQFYDHSCPKAQEIVKSIVAKAVAKEARMAASLLRLHFHDCFVKGCDASILLDSSGTIVSEKGSNPNRNSVRGFEVIDEIKSALEKACPHTVSCADILALAARDSTVLTILTKFKLKGLDLVDLVALSGSHTIGLSRCTSFRQRLYNQTGKGFPDFTLDPAYAAHLRTRCPRSGGDQNLFPLDFVSPTKFDNSYFRNLMAKTGLLSSDEILFTNNPATMHLVELYAAHNELFFQHFVRSMVKMGNITPLTGNKGEIRTNCRKLNHP